MDGIKRNLLYWGYTIGQMILTIIVMVLIISIVTGLDEIGGILHSFCVTMSAYGATYMLLLMAVLGMALINNHMPLTLSMGSTRRDSFIGMEIMLHVEGLLLIGIIIAAGIFSGKAVSGMSFFNSVLLLAASAALCNLIGWAFLRYGKVVSLILYVVVFITGALGIYVLSALHAAGRLGLSEKWGWPVLAAAVMAVVTADGITIWLYARDVKKMEVRV